MENKDNLLGVAQTLWKWRRPIIIVCLIAVIGTAGASLLMPNYYQATTLFFAASPDQSKPELVFNQGNLRSEYYGNANDIDRLITIAESNELVSFLVDSFQLYEHYKIDPESPRAPFRVREKFFSLYEIKKTKRDAIALSIEDKDKKFAARMAKAAREKIDETAQALIKEGQQKAIHTFETEVKMKQKQLQILGDTLNKMRQIYGLYNTVAQTESLTAQQSEAEAKLVRNQTRLEVLKGTAGVPRDTIVMLTALVKGLETEVQNLSQKILLLNQGIAPINTLEKQYYESNLSLSLDLERLKMWKAVYESYVPTTILIEEAEVPIIKSRPKRSILVLTAGALAFIFSAFAVLLFDAYQHVKWFEIGDKNARRIE